MKKKHSCFFCFLILFLFSLHALAASETLFNDYIQEEASETIDSITYTVYGYNDYEGARLSSNQYGSIILESVGSSIVKGPYTFSLSEILEEDNIVSFKITIEKQEAEVTMSREVSNATVHLDQQVEVTVKLSNDGSDTVTVTYAENLPSEVHHIGVPEITKGTSTQSQKSTVADVYWNGVLYSGEEATITYTVEVDSYPSSGSTIHFNDVEFTYEDSSGEYSSTADTLTLSLTDPLQIDFILETEEDAITVGTETEYTLTLTNSMDNTVTVSNFLLELPSTVTISHMDTQLEDSADGYTWSGTLNPFEDTSFSFIVVPKRGGSHSFDAAATYTYGARETSYDTSASTSFSIEVADVIPEIKLSSESFDGNEPIIIHYYVNNSDKEVSYSNVEMTITSDPELFEPVHYIASLPKNTKTLIKKQNFTAPYTDTKIEYELTLEGDLDGATFDEDAVITINPTSFTAPYALSYAIDGIDEENTNVTMTLTLLTDLAEKPTKLAVVHTAEDYKKTISLGTENIESLFSTKMYTKSWNIPTLSYSGDSVDLGVQLQYTTSSGIYYKSFTETIPVFEEAIEEIIEEGNETLSNETVAIEANETETNVTLEEVEEAEEEEEVVITGEKEQTSKKFIWFFVILASLILLVLSLRYFFAKKHKESAIKKTIASITSKEPGKEEKKESIFARAKEIIIQEVPSPEEGYDKLENYIKTALNQGKAHEEIKKILLAKGWIEDILESYLRRLK